MMMMMMMMMMWCDVTWYDLMYIMSNILNNHPWLMNKNHSSAEGAEGCMSWFPWFPWKIISNERHPCFLLGSLGQQKGQNLQRHRNSTTQCSHSCQGHHAALLLYRMPPGESTNGKWKPQGRQGTCSTKFAREIRRTSHTMCGTIFSSWGTHQVKCTWLARQDEPQCFRSHGYLQDFCVFVAYFSQTPVVARCNLQIKNHWKNSTSKKEHL